LGEGWVEVEGHGSRKEAEAGLGEWKGGVFVHDPGVNFLRGVNFLAV
jgi:hypothetical protein